MFLTSVLTRTLFPQAEPTRLSHEELEVKEHLPINSAPWDGLASLVLWVQLSRSCVQLSEFQSYWKPGGGPKLQFHAVNGEAVAIKSCCPHVLYGVPLGDPHL